MKILLSSLSLRRVTSGGKYVPEIDGLRFIALTSVLIYHLNGFWVTKRNELDHFSNSFMSIWNSIMSTGNVGVQLFFVISGYILGLPFANKYLGNGKDVPLSQYFKRRMTRLEPPYIIIMLLLFVMSIYVAHKYTFTELLPSLLASLTYTHNFFYGREVLPLINGVAWSLEIEVQFYILVPLLVMMFKLPKISRRMLLLAVSVGFIIFQSVYQLPFRSIIDYIQFFLIGFLLADFKITNEQKEIKKSWVTLIGFISLGMIFFTNKYSYHQSNLPLNLMLFFWIAVFNYMCLFQGFLKNFLSNSIISIIGGMCYSIYMIHPAAISIVGNKYLGHLFFNSFYLNFIFYYIILLLFILTISSIYFLLIERPCMDKNWPKILLSGIRHRYRVSQRFIYSMIR